MPPMQPTRPTESTSFVPKSTIQTRQDQAKLLAQASKKQVGKKTSEASTQDSHGTGTSPRDFDSAGPPSVDIFGLRRGHDGMDDFVPEEGDSGGFWMPDLAVASKPASPEPRPTTNRPGEIFDGYHVWQEWQSRTAGKPFWHCKETGETRWEKPEAGAVQKPDKRPQSTEAESGTLQDGDFDEEANRREFLQALYEWRNGGQVKEEEETVPKGSKSEAPKKTVPPVTKQTPASAEASKSRPTSARATVISQQASARAPQSATLQSAAGNGQTALVTEMLQANAAPNAPDRFGLSALHYAAGGGHVAIIECLVAAKATLDTQDKDGDTPLHTAVKAGREAAVRRLLELGATAELVNEKGNAPGRVAAMFGREKLGDLLERAAQVRAEAVASGRGEAGVKPLPRRGSNVKASASAGTKTSVTGTASSTMGTATGTVGNASGTSGTAASAVRTGASSTPRARTGKGTATGTMGAATSSSGTATSTMGIATRTMGAATSTDGTARTSEGERVAKAKPMAVTRSEEAATADTRAGEIEAQVGEEGGEVDVEAMVKARSLLEGLRKIVREEVEVKYGSRPSSAASARGASRGGVRTESKDAT